METKNFYKMQVALLMSALREYENAKDRMQDVVFHLDKVALNNVQIGNGEGQDGFEEFAKLARKISYMVSGEAKRLDEFVEETEALSEFANV